MSGLIIDTVKARSQSTTQSIDNNSKRINNNTFEYDQNIEIIDEMEVDGMCDDTLNNNIVNDNNPDVGFFCGNLTPFFSILLIQWFTENNLKKISSYTTSQVRK